MKIILGADHGGFQIKENIKVWLEEQGHELIDVGADDLDPQDDYPVFAFAAAKEVAANKNAVGVLFCRSGAGMTIAANKVKDIRAVEVFNVISVKHAKQHNNANMIALSADWLKLEEIKEIIQVFLSSEFTGEGRHQRRIDQIKNIENKSCVCACNN